MRDNAVVGLVVFALVCGVLGTAFGLTASMTWIVDNFGDRIAFYTLERPGIIALVFFVLAAVAALLESWIRKTWP